MVGVEAPDGSPGVAHGRPPAAAALLHEVHLHDVAVSVLVLDQHGEVDLAGALLDVEADLEARELAGHPGELDVDDPRAAELVVAAGLGQLAEGGAAEVEVVGRHARGVVHVRDHHRLGAAGAGGVLGAGAPDLVAGTAAFAVAVQRLVAARGHGHERVLVHLLEPASAACIYMEQQQPWRSGDGEPSINQQMHAYRS